MAGKTWYFGVTSNDWKIRAQEVRTWHNYESALFFLMEWLMWQMGGLGPMCDQVHYYLRNNPGKAEHTEDRLRSEVARLYSVLNTSLDRREFICDEYSIADMACWPWVSRFEWHQVDLAEYPHVRAWYKRLVAREAVQKGYQVPKNAGKIPAG